MVIWIVFAVITTAIIASLLHPLASGRDWFKDRANGAAQITDLDAKLSEGSNDLNGWLRLVRSCAVLDKRSQAAAALERGLAAFPPSGEQGRQLLALARELGISTEGSTQ